MTRQTRFGRRGEAVEAADLARMDLQPGQQLILVHDATARAPDPANMRGATNRRAITRPRSVALGAAGVGLGSVTGFIAGRTLTGGSSKDPEVGGTGGGGSPAPTANTPAEGGGAGTPSFKPFVLGGILGGLAGLVAGLLQGLGLDAATAATAASLLVVLLLVFGAIALFRRFR